MEDGVFERMVKRYFRGELNNDEYNRFSDLLLVKENRNYFDQLKQEWELKPEETEVARKNWKSVHYKIHNQKFIEKRLTYTRRIWLRVASVAAILVIGLIAGTVLTRFFFGNDVFVKPLVFETPRGEKSIVTLPDGSKVWLNANSKLTCYSFTNISRNVELSGEAYFKVARNENSPFRVKTNECEVEVLGTEFNVMAYDDFGRKEITLFSGKVDVNYKNQKQEISPGETFVLRGEKSWIENTNVAYASAWVENKFDFRNIPLSELMKRLENWYDVDIDLVNPNKKEVNFTGTFKNEESIWQVLDAIKVYMPITYKKTDLRKIKISVE